MPTTQNNPGQSNKSKTWVDRTNLSLAFQETLCSYVVHSIFFAPGELDALDSAADRRGARIGAVAAALCAFKAFLAAKAQRLPRAAVDVLTQVIEATTT